MICDWLGAGIVYSKQKVDYNRPYKEPFDYYNAHLKERIFHKDTQKLIEFYLNLIKEKGINAFCVKVKKRGYEVADYNNEYLL